MKSAKTAIALMHPSFLHSIKDFPPLLFIKGNLPATNYAAVVGTREPSPLAKDKTDFIVKAFAEHNFGILSRLASGIDTLAHEAAIKSNTVTAAVLPTPVDNIFPKENLLLANTIIEKGGCIISEQAPNYAPVANPFVFAIVLLPHYRNILFPSKWEKIPAPGMQSIMQ